MFGRFGKTVRYGAGAGLLLMSACTQAMIFGGTASGAWINSDSSVGVTITNDDAGATAQVAWGVPVAGSFASRLDFDGAGSDGGPGWAALAGDAFALGTLSHSNGTVTGTDLSGVDLRVTLEMSVPLDLSSSFQFDFHIVNTPNLCQPLPGCADDILTFVNPLSGSGFVFQDVAYSLILMGFSEDSGLSFSTDLSIAEQASRGTVLYGRIQQVPVTGTFPLLAGLLLVTLLPTSARRSGAAAARC